MFNDPDAYSSKKYLYVFEYNVPWGAGSIVAIAENINDCLELIKPKEAPIIDKKMCTWHKVLTRLYEKNYNVDGVNIDELNTSLKAILNKYASDYYDEWHKKISKTFNEENSLSQKVRIDWALGDFMHELEEGLYLVETIQVSDTENPREVSHVFHDG